MSAGSFAKTSLAWQLHQLQQQISEWLELKFSQVPWKIPEATWTETLWDSPWVVVLMRLVLWGGVLGLATGLLWKWLPWLRHYYQELQLRWRQGRAQTPLPVREMTVKQWLARSQQQQQQGNYREASRALYLAMLQTLHDKHVVRHQPGRTDGEYWQQLQGLSHSQAYQVLLQTHGQLCFGEAEISAEQFARCQQAYLELERL